MWPGLQWVELLSLTLADHLMYLIILVAFLKQNPKVLTEKLWSSFVMSLPNFDYKCFV